LQSLLFYLISANFITLFFLLANGLCADVSATHAVLSVMVITSFFIQFHLDRDHGDHAGCDDVGQPVDALSV
jgi:hypothetical protein